MISAFASTWRVPELRHRILFTLALIVIIRLGVHIALPGVDVTVIKELLDIQMQQENSSNPAAAVGALLNVFSGGALQQCGIFALGIMPYISASIMIQLLTAVVPQLAKLAREDGGRQKITQYTRYLTILIAIVQAFLLAGSLKFPNNIPYFTGIEKVGRDLVIDPSAMWMVLVVITLVAGTMLLMWLGDQMTDRGIGNGTSVIIAVNIISALPAALVQTWRHFVKGGDGAQNAFSALILVGLIAFLIFVIAAVIAITQAQRRIAIQYAKRVVGRKMFGGTTQYLPLKVNYAGVMPIIFASAVLGIPTMLIGWIAKGADWAVRLQTALNPGSPYYFVIAGTMIFFFSYFWVATMFQPAQISEDLKRNGGYIPGVKPGKPTADFLDFTMSRLTFAGAIFLTMVFAMPMLLHLPGLGLNIPQAATQFFGGTSLLILVGVVLDVMRQVETHLLQRNYDGFLRKGKIRGRYDRSQGVGQAASSTVLVYLYAVIALLIVIGVASWLAK